MCAPWRWCPVPPVTGFRLTHQRVAQQVSRLLLHPVLHGGLVRIQLGRDLLNGLARGVKLLGLALPLSVRLVAMCFGAELPMPAIRFWGALEPFPAHLTAIVVL